MCIIKTISENRKKSNIEVKFNACNRFVYICVNNIKPHRVKNMFAFMTVLHFKLPSAKARPNIKNGYSQHLIKATIRSDA